LIKRSRSHLVEHLLEALSLAISSEAQDPPNPITRAALQHSMQDLIAELRALGGESQQETPDSTPISQAHHQIDGLDLQ
jgi:hypothetical protein